ncbi:MAG: class I SAM-dependent methyltransferase [Alphaproteobacteria bacterium]|nr:class I SAM-dependent methyltransferase [Alphaproteobacteria bacterium]
MRLPLAELAAAYDALAPDYDSLDPHEDAATYWRHVCTNVVVNSADPEPDDVVLDLGCGTGNVARTLAPHVRSVTGLDCSPGMLARARALQPAGVSWRQGDLRDPTQASGLTLLTSCWSLHHLSPEELRALWRRAHALLPRGGRLVVGELFHSLPPEDIEGAEGWLDEANAYPHSAQQALQDIEAVGFTAVLKVLHPAASVLWAVRR